MQETCNIGRTRWDMANGCSNNKWSTGANDNIRFRPLARKLGTHPTHRMTKTTSLPRGWHSRI